MSNVSCERYDIVAIGVEGIDAIELTRRSSTYRSEGIGCVMRIFLHKVCRLGAGS